MAETPPEIQIYALFPLVVAPGAGLDLDPSNWRWVHCLTFPINTLRVLQFSRRPFKWICYSIGVVVGAEGDLFSSSHIGSPNMVDYDAGLPAQTAMLYYHISDEEKRRMFPINPNIQCTNITSSAPSTRRDHFRQGVAVRDGNQCILTGIEPDLCQAAHLLAHSKGDSVCHFYSSSILVHHLRGCSTLRLILSVAAEIPPAVILYMMSTVFETVSVYVPHFTLHWYKTSSHS